MLKSATIRRVILEDEKQFQERFHQETLRDLTNPQDVFNAVHEKTKGTRATNHFLSMMQHLLLIREEGQPLVHYFQLLDSIVTDVVMEKKLPGAEQRLGFPVSRIIAQFNEVDRYQRAEDEAAKARAHAVRLNLEKEALEDELYGGLDGLVGRLKSTHIRSGGKADRLKRNYHTITWSACEPKDVLRGKDCSTGGSDHRVVSHA
jgi:cytokinesis protein